MAATAAFLVLCGAGYVALAPENPETAEPEAAIAATEAFLGVTLAGDPTRTRVLLIREDRPLIRVMMVLPDAAYTRLAQVLNDAHRHDPRREVQGLPGPDAQRVQTHSPWRASYFTVDGPDAGLIWVYARPLEQDLTEVQILAYDPDPEALEGAPSLTGITALLRP